MQESKQEPVLPYFWSLCAGQNFSIYSVWVPVSEASAATTSITVGGRHHHCICGCKYVLDCITLELVSVLQFGDSSGKHDSLLVILVELLESCTDNTPPCITTELEPFIHQETETIHCISRTDGLNARFYHRLPICLWASCTKDFSGHWISISLSDSQSSANVSYLFSFNSVVCPICLDRILFQAKNSSHCALSLLLYVTFGFCNQSTNIHDPSC